jgi:prevent-host-death family protein
MTMGKMKHVVPAGEFKAKCLALLDEVAETGETLTVTKHGKPVARVVPIEAPDLRGSIVSQKDLVSPTGEDWDASS